MKKICLRFIPLTGFLADISGAFVAIQVVAWIGLASGIVVILLMKKLKHDAFS